MHSAEQPTQVLPRIPAKIIRFTVWPDCRSRHAAVKGVSARGLGLLCLEPVEPGTALLLRLAPQGRTAWARVVHVQPARGVWLLGCSLAEPLREEELQAYLAGGGF